MDKKVYTIADFRKILEKVIDDKLENTGDGFDVLNTMQQMSDEELLKAKLYADLGLDSIDVMQTITLFEAFNDVSIMDEAENALGTGVSLTVEKFLDIISTYQESYD